MECAPRVLARLRATPRNAPPHVPTRRRPSPRRLRTPLGVAPAQFGADSAIRGSYIPPRAAKSAPNNGMRPRVCSWGSALSDDVCSTFASAMARFGADSAIRGRDFPPRAAKPAPNHALRRHVCSRGSGHTAERAAIGARTPWRPDHVWGGSSRSGQKFPAPNGGTRPEPRDPAAARLRAEPRTTPEPGARATSPRTGGGAARRPAPVQGRAGSMDHRENPSTRPLPAARARHRAQAR